MGPPAVLAIEHIHPPDKQAGVSRAAGHLGRNFIGFNPGILKAASNEKPVFHTRLCIQVSPGVKALGGRISM